MSGDPKWSVEVVAGSAAALHEQALDLIAGGGAEPRRSVRILEVTTTALVLGSAQPGSHVDQRAVASAGVDVARRHSGGSAVLVGARHCLWIDVAIPPGDPLWSPDVHRAATWLGEVWVDALAGSGAPGGDVWRSAMVRPIWSSYVCFAGLAPGEVTLRGSKVVGISQRRSRAGTLFQCAVPLCVDADGPIGPWDYGSVIGLLALTPEMRLGAASLSKAAVAVADPTSLCSAFLAQLDSLG